MCATASDWKCRHFEVVEPNSVDMALTEALHTLGREGWELVSVKENPRTGRETYFFKRQEA
jgi:hypothetical protein